jgi:hypothetical protein
MRSSRGYSHLGWQNSTSIFPQTITLAAATISEIPSLRLERHKAQYVKGVSCWREGWTLGFQVNDTECISEEFLGNIEG